MSKTTTLAVSREDLAACRALLRKGSKSFHAASLLLPGRLRPAVSGMYAFCRVSDDAVDSGDRRAEGLEGLRERLDLVYRGAPREGPVDRVFAAVVEAFAIPRAVPEALLEGFEWDVAGRRYETISDVRAYGVRVASTVGVMMSLLMGRRGASALARAADLGVAMQLTNIARDVGEDARAGRVYLPAEWLLEAGVDPEELLARPAFSPALGEVVERLLAEADRLYARADHGILMLPWDCRPAIRAARMVYADIGREIRRAELDSVTRRAYTTSWRKVRLILGALIGLGARGAGGGGEDPPLDEARFLVVAR